MSQIPDLMRIGALPSNTEMNVDSDILEPVVFSLILVLLLTVMVNLIFLLI